MVTKVQVNKGDFSQFLNQVGLSSRVPDCVLLAKSNQIQVKAVGHEHLVFLQGGLKAKTIEEGKIIIPSIQQFQAVLDRFSSDTIQLQATTKNIKVLQKGKQGTFTIMAEHMMESTAGLSDFKETDYKKLYFKAKKNGIEAKFSKKNSFTTSVNVLKEIISDATVVGEELYNFCFAADKNKLKVIIENDTKSARFTVIPELEEVNITKNFRTTMGSGLREIVTSSGGEALVFFFNPKGKGLASMPVWIKVGKFNYILQTQQEAEEE